VQFLQRMVTGDETWVHHVTPDAKRASMTWKHASSPLSNKLKITQSSKKIMATAFLDHLGVLLVGFLTQGDTVNSDLYCDTMSRLREAIRRKRPGLLRRGVVLLRDNARPHTANRTREMSRRYNWEVLDHPPYSPDLPQSDFHLFGPLKKHLVGRRFATDGEVQQAARSWLQALDTDFFYAGIDALVYQWDKCLGKCGDYVQK
jgi:histone-lysine N-methyltransferase SETMAR